MKSRDIALAFIRREAEEAGELTLFALRTAQEHRIGYDAMMAAAREGLRRRSARLSRATPPSPESQSPTSHYLPPTPMTYGGFEDLNTDDQTLLADIRADLVRHERLLADARRSGLPAKEVHEIEALIRGDHGLIAAIERKIARDEQAATDPALLELRRIVDTLSFEECVVALINREGAGPTSIPSNTPEDLQHLRMLVFEGARDGHITLPRRRRKSVARRLPIVTIDGTRFYRDDRLGEYRAVDNPHDRRPF